MSNTDPTPDWLENFVRVFEKNPDRAIKLILSFPDDDSPAPDPAAPFGKFTPEQIERLQRTVNAAYAANPALAG